jgi:hypothetical protein
VYTHLFSDERWNSGPALEKMALRNLWRVGRETKISRRKKKVIKSLNVVSTYFCLAAQGKDFRHFI